MLNGYPKRTQSRGFALAARLLLLAGLASSNSYADEVQAGAEPTLPTHGKFDFGVTHLVQLTVLQNAAAGASRLQAEAAEKLLQAERGLYEPTLFSRVRREHADRPRLYEERTVSLTNIEKATARERTFSASNGVRGKLPSGATFELSHEMRQRQSNLLATTTEREYRGSLFLTIKQPLLRGAGRNATEAELRVAEKEQQIEQQRFLKQLLDTVGEAAGTYWQLYRAEQLLALRERAVKNAINLSEDVRRRVDGGFAPRVDLLEAEVAIGGRAAELARAKQQLVEANARIRNLLNLSTQAYPQLNFGAIEAPRDVLPAADEAAPSEPPVHMLLRWPAYRIAQLRFEQERIRLELAQNQERPDISLELGYNGNSLASGFGLGVADSFRNIHPGWYAGFSLEMQVGSVTPRSRREGQALKFDAARLQMESEAHMLSNEWVTRQGQAQVSLRELGLLRQEVSMREALFAAERSHYELGRGRLRQLIEAEDRLEESRSRLLEGAVRAQTVALSVQALSGGLFESFGLQVYE